MKATTSLLIGNASLIFMLAIQFIITKQLDSVVSQQTLAGGESHFVFQHQKTHEQIIHKTPTIVIPKYLHSLGNTLNYTNYIGTQEHPTIDGGIINSTENRLVNNSSPIDQSYNHRETIPIVHSQTRTYPGRAFKDNWATDYRVRQFLTAASDKNKLGYILSKAKEMGLPASVAAVPLVESGYQVNAISNKGAGGAWQLMPKTAQDFGVDNNQRFVFRLSTNAALKYLYELYTQFGNWELAYAAYNAGSSRVNNAIKRNPEAREIDELELPQETKIYVKRLRGLNQAIMEIASHGT
jgi:hypothetical protein